MKGGENAHLGGVGAGNSVAWWATEDSGVNYNLACPVHYRHTQSALKASRRSHQNLGSAL
jgi:hypothetical protein